ncbi:MAG: gliding motility protein GldL [Prevotellaceae bacterium]|nr:gliding motility protein GldL [Candidatus Colivivens equi]
MMGASSFNIVAKLQHWMDSNNGQMFMNYAYSWGASIVILGALFKLTHMTGADIMLFIGMGTEVLVFFISGFERQFEEISDAENTLQTGGVTIVGNLGGNTPESVNAGELANKFAGFTENATNGNVVIGGGNIQTPEVVGMNTDMEDATKNYVEQLNELTSTLKSVAEQSARLTRDSEEMETMNRTLTGINRFYEMQLRSVSNQSTTIDEVNNQTKMLAAKLEELNNVYARMVEAMQAHMGVTKVD